MLLTSSEEERQIDEDFNQVPEDAVQDEVDHLARRVVSMI